ncbi:MAG: VanZ family protein [Propionibacteriaceae bacterium]|nr:VanZ family protein [Propionibacteriaceae bacterium]
MSDQIADGILAIIGGLFVAAALFVPFAILNYRRRGAMSTGRTVTWIAFVVYFMAIWTYTLLPFPAPGYTCTGRNLHLFQFVDDIRAYGVTTPVSLLQNPAFLQFALNVVLFIPLGFGLRLLWRRGWLTTTIAGLLLSLFIETTQVTGVWGIYDCAYRVFDVDDLLANTSGAFIGGILSWPVSLLTRFDDPVDLARAPKAVTLGRRLIAMICDWIVVAGATLVLGISVNVVRYYVLGIREREDYTSSSLIVIMISLIPAILVFACTFITRRTPGDIAVDILFVRRRDLALPGRGMATLRCLAGIGGYQLLSLPTDQRWSLLFALVSLVFVFVTKSRGGLPGAILRLDPVISRVWRSEHDGQALTKLHL